MSNKKNIASILMLGATTIGLSNSMSTSAGLFDILDWGEAKARGDKKNEQGYKTAEKVAKIFLEHFDNEKKKSSEKNKDKNNVMAVLEDLVLEKFYETELVNYYKKKFKNMTEKITLNKNDIPDILDSFGKNSDVEGKTKNKELKIIEVPEELEEKELKKELNEKSSENKNIATNLVDTKKVNKNGFKKEEKFSFLGCLGKTMRSIKSTIAGQVKTFKLGLSCESGNNVIVNITYKKVSGLKKYMSELEKKLLEKVNSEAKKEVFNFKIKQVEGLVKEAKNKGITYEKIINTFFKKLDVEEGVLNYLKNLFLNNPFSNNHLTNILWSKSSQEGEKNGTARVVELKDGEKEILHELGYERNNSWFRSGVRLGVSIALTSAVVAGLSAAFPLIAGVAAAPIGVALTGFVATIVDRVAFKTRFKEYRKIKSWNPKNWEVQRFLKDTVKNTITSALWALSIGQVLPSFF